MVAEDVRQDGEAGVGESAFVRGVGWISPITQIG